MNKKTLEERLKNPIFRLRYRKFEGEWVKIMNQTQLIENIDITQGMITKIETNQLTPSCKLLYGLLVNKRITTKQLKEILRFYHDEQHKTAQTL